jgi:hypothetical protein
MGDRAENEGLTASQMLCIAVFAAFRKALWVADNGDNLDIAELKLLATIRNR